MNTVPGLRKANDMYDRVERNSALLWSLLAPAAAYLAWQYYWPWYSGNMFSMALPA